MSDNTKEKDETVIPNLQRCENQPAPQTEKTNGDSDGRVADASFVSESGGSVPMDTADVTADNDIGTEAENKVSPAEVIEDKKIVTEAENEVSCAEAAENSKNGTETETMVDDNKVGTEAENMVSPVEAVGDKKNGNVSADDTVEKPAVIESQEKVVAGAESVDGKLIPDGTVAKEGASASETETLVKPDQPVAPGSEMAIETVEASDVKADVLPVSEIKADVDQEMVLSSRDEDAEVKAASGDFGEDIENQVTATGEKLETNERAMVMSTPVDNGSSLAKLSFLLDDDDDGSDSGTEMEQVAFMKELECFFRMRSMEFKPPKFYGEGLNLLKLWRAVMRLGGYDKVTSCKLWRQVGESFRPPKTCTTVSWTFRGFYEKSLLDYERHKVSGGEVILPITQLEPGIEHQGSGSGRARRDAAARAMQGWHSHRLLGNGEDKTPVSLQKREKQLRNSNSGLLKRKKPSYVESAIKVPRTQASKTHLDITVVDLGPPADWVKINVQRTKDCFEVYALVPGLLREEVRVQSDPAGRLVISGEPEHPENPWGVTPFKKVVSLPSRIDPHQTSAVVTLHGQLFVRVPFEQSEQL